MLAISRSRFKVATNAENLIEWEVQGFAELVRMAPALPATSTEALTVGSNLTLESDPLVPDAAHTARWQAINMLSMQGTPPAAPAESWEQTVGMFDNDPIINEILDAGQRIRESRRPR